MLLRDFNAGWFEDLGRSKGLMQKYANARSVLHSLEHITVRRKTQTAMLQDCNLGQGETWEHV